MTGRRHSRPSGDEGQVLVLSLVFTSIALALVIVVVAVTSVHLERKRLLTLADGAALHAASVIDEAEFYGGAPGEAPALTRASVEAAASDYLSRSPEAAKLRDLAMVEASTPEGETAAVTLVAVARPALVGWLVDLVDDGIVITASSSARGQ
ncbi:pilus assembly protein TadG-related protein [Flavimobilis marinus]|uniref:pilus assembly protein TadG-related protein n=1 Tax=Flavimobilis marinus TaxID=285351 RepID=UPI000B803E48|nr:pilus assembly protein TadG-related protein [Flavimobilis marinus]